MNIKIEKTNGGLFRATGDEVRLHVVGGTPAEALRNAADFLDEMDSILAGRSKRAQERREQSKEK